MIGVAKHQTAAGSQLSGNTQPVAYSLSWPTTIGISPNPPAIENLLSWNAQIVNYWIYIQSSVGQSETQSFRIGGINFGYNGPNDQLYINECVFTGITPDSWYSILYQNSQAGADTIVFVNDTLPADRNFEGYIQDDPLDSPTAYQPATTNQNIGDFTRAARNKWEINQTPGIYTDLWSNPIIGLVRYSTQAQDLTHRNQYSARWTAYNDQGLPGRDANKIWQVPYLGYPTRTEGTSNGFVTHAYAWPNGFQIGAKIVDPEADGTPLADFPMRETLGMGLAVRWTPTNDALYAFPYPPLA